MTDFPPSPWYTGLNRPLGEEYDLTDLIVEGAIPAEVAGTFFRATPDPVFAPFLPDAAAALSGDGMISALRIKGGKASFAMRFVQTERYLAERAAGEALFGVYRNPFTDKPAVAGVDRTVANTTPVWHAGKLLMTKEDGRPYRIDPATLETLGSYDFGGKLKSETMTAHVRVDPATGELFFYGYECDGLASTKVAYCIADKAGALVSEQWLDMPYCSMMHDFCITENYALFPVYPTTCDLDRLKAGGDHWAHQADGDSWLGVMPRYGDVSEVRWFKGPKGVHCFHMMNAFEELGEDGAVNIHFDQCLTRTNAFSFIREAGGIHLQPWEVEGGLTRWTVRYDGGADEVVETPIGPPCDFPVIPAVSQGRPYDHGWVLTMNPEMQGPPLMGGPVLAMFNLLLRLDLTGKGPPHALALPQGGGYNEPVHVPSAQTGHDGWLITFVDQQTGPGPDDFAHAAWIIDAGNVAAGPVAKIAIPHRQRPQIHGWWASQASLDAAA